MSWSRGHGRYLMRRYVVGVLCWAGTHALTLMRPLIPSALVRLDRPIFIVGCSRAGTTLFAGIFQSHPDVAGWMDASQIWDLHRYAKNGDDYRDERHANLWESARLRAIFGLYACLKGRKRLVNKNNQNALRLRLLNRVFPDCIVLHVVRDARPVVQSAVHRMRTDSFRRRFPFGQFPKPIRWREYVDLPLVERFAHQWTDITRYVQGQGTELFGHSRYVEVRFEDFCAHPEYVLARVDAFCGLDHARRDLKSVTRIDMSRNDGWRDGLNDRELERIDAIAGPQMTHLGYPPK